MNTIANFFTPQLKKLHTGKVRDSYYINDKSRIIVSTDRISAFDHILNNTIPHKGSILNRLSNFWFFLTKDIIDNHFLKQIHPNITLVKETVPLKVEVIVRNYITGSMWREYINGKRIFSGIKVENNLQKNRKLSAPIVTPTTKDKSDQEITPEEIIFKGLISESNWKKIHDKSLELFKFGSNYLADKKLILVDTKYEFGLLDNNIILIDELHTPDSSRIWPVESYEKDPLSVTSLDKEFVRSWLLSNISKDNKIPDTLPEQIVNETSNRYKNIYQQITEYEISSEASEDINYHMTKQLVSENFIKDGFIAIIIGSKLDMSYALEISDIIKKYDIAVPMHIISAHKNGEKIVELASNYNRSIESGAVIAIAGLSNGLGGALAANLNIPVINCPPFKDNIDMMLNINSSLMMPSKTPALTVLNKENAALAALRTLNFVRLKNIFSQEVAEMKK